MSSTGNSLEKFYTGLKHENIRSEYFFRQSKCQLLSHHSKKVFSPWEMSFSFDLDGGESKVEILDGSLFLLPFLNSSLYLDSPEKYILPQIADKLLPEAVSEFQYSIFESQITIPCKKALYIEFLDELSNEIFFRELTLGANQNFVASFEWLVCYQSMSYSRLSSFNSFDYLRSLPSNVKVMTLGQRNHIPYASGIQFKLDTSLVARSTLFDSFAAEGIVPLGEGKLSESDELVSKEAIAPDMFKCIYRHKRALKDSIQNKSEELEFYLSKIKKWEDCLNPSYRNFVTHYLKDNEK